MEQEESGFSVLDVIQEIMETERSFHNVIRFLDGSTRNQLVSAQQRNTNNAMALVREYLRLNSQPPTMVMNIPLNIDASGNFFDPVPVVPTREQINAALENHVNVSETTCSVCQEGVTCASRVRGCGHCFHSDCIRQWFSMNPRCPMCRLDIRDPPSNNDRRMHTDEE